MSASVPRRDARVRPCSVRPAPHGLTAAAPPLLSCPRHPRPPRGHPGLRLRSSLPLSRRQRCVRWAGMGRRAFARASAGGAGHGFRLRVPCCMDRSRMGVVAWTAVAWALSHGPLSHGPLSRPPVARYLSRAARHARTHEERGVSAGCPAGICALGSGISCGPASIHVYNTPWYTPARCIPEVYTVVYTVSVLYTVLYTCIGCECSPWDNYSYLINPFQPKTRA